MCEVDCESHEVTLVGLREEIYRKYFFEKVFKANSSAKKFKQIRIPEAIHEHDIENKAKKILGMVKRGEHQFKIYSENDSSKCQEAIRTLCRFLGKEPHFTVEEHEVLPRTRRKNSVKIERWQVRLDFHNEATVDYDKVDRKWRKYCMLESLKRKRGEEEE